jgi:hypothetical protein
MAQRSEISSASCSATYSQVGQSARGFPWESSGEASCSIFIISSVLYVCHTLPTMMLGMRASRIHYGAVALLSLAEHFH